MAEFYQLETAQAIAELKSNAESGLSAQEALNRQAELGKNVLPTGEGTSLIRLIISQFTNIMVMILIAAAVISWVLGDIEDVIAIMVIVVLNAALGTFQEHRAEQALAALGAMQVPLVRVRRDGKVQEISARDLVPGDIVLLQEGDRIPADGRLLVAKSLNIEEAALTGESMPVEKNIAAINEGEVGLGDRKNMAFMGTAINFGRGEMLVTGIALKTELGKIASLLMGVEEGRTPLQRRLDHLSVLLVRGAVLTVIIVFCVGLLRGIALDEMLVTAISLAVAAIPEGLPAIITVSLSLGAARMVRRNALIRRLPAVETLGSVTVICSDKTGTLTKNEMTATLLALPGHDDVQVTGIGYTDSGDFITPSGKLDPKTNSEVGRFLQAMTLDTDAYLEPNPATGGYSVVGDTTEGALLIAAQKVGWTRNELEQRFPRVAELPFSSERKAMTTVHRIDNDNAKARFENAPFISITKGAPDRLIGWATTEHTPNGVIPLSDERRQAWVDKVDELASQGLRVLGVAYRPLQDMPTEMTPQIERELNLLGLIGILDPARPEARDAVAVARAAGIRPIMITGDHALTAEAIARDLGILREGEKAITGAELEKMADSELVKALARTSAFARVSPEHKLKLVKALQSQGHVVAMTGDGVNDAPALKQADIGVAMGITGTEVSKGAADMVLTDDNFASIVAAVEEGRTIYDNIRKFVRYLLSSNVGEILVMLVAILIGWQIPLLAIQILWVNLVTDGLPAIALGFEPAESGTMKRKPRATGESIFARGLGRQIIGLAVVLAIVTLAGFVYGHTSLGLDPFSPTLNIESLSREQLSGFASVDLIPADWESMSTEDRLVAIEGDETSGSSHGSSEGLLGAAERLPRTIAFTVLALGQMFHVAGIRAGNQVSFFSVGFRKNRLLLYAILSTLVLQLLVIYVPFLQSIMETAALSLGQLLVCGALASIVLAGTELERLLFARHQVEEIHASA
jgi:Ca2+-transporting ATPase